MTPNEQEQNLTEFNRMIFPVWGKTWRAWEASFEREDCEPELTVLHRCDLLVLESGYKPNRLSVASATSSRASSAKKARYGAQYSEAMRP